MSRTETDKKINLAIGKKIKEARENYYITVKEIVDGEFRGTHKPVRKFITQSKLAKGINVTFQQIQKYEKGTNGLSSIRLLQISNFFKKPLEYFTSDATELLAQDNLANNNSDIILAPTTINELN